MLLSLFACPEGAVMVRAKGLRRPGSKLAHVFKPADELQVSAVRGRTRMPVLTGASLGIAHPAWREDINLLALYWFVIECARLSSSSPAVNEQVYGLLVDLLRREPLTHSSQVDALADFGISLLSLHGLMPDLARCAIDGHLIEPDEPVHLLPSGEGIVGRDAYNHRYARTGAVLVRMDPARLARWRSMVAGTIRGSDSAAGDATDAALVLHFTALRLAEATSQNMRTAAFLQQQWRLPSFQQVLAGQHSQP